MTCFTSPSDRFVRQLRAGFYGYGAVGHHKRSIYNDDRLIVARLLVNKIPSRFVAETSEMWAGLYPDDPDEAERFAPIDELRGRDDGVTVRCPLTNGGSLLWVMELWVMEPWVMEVEVYPAFAGYRLGGKPLLHSLWALARHPGDLAYLEAFPIRVFFTEERVPAEHQTTETEMRRIVRFFRAHRIHAGRSLTPIPT
jgi:hypothetical protein